MNTDLTITLSLEKMNVVMAALGRMPFDQVFQLVNELNQQLQPQLQPLQATNAVAGKTPA